MVLAEGLQLGIELMHAILVCRIREFLHSFVELVTEVR